MRPFAYEQPTDLAHAVLVGSAADTAYLAGGTTLVDLMKLNVMRPTRLVDIGGLARGEAPISQSSSALRLGAFARMADVADDETIKRDYPVISQSLDLAASAQLRNMATLGGNVLQRTRCTYFRDTSWSACNKRNPGSGCAAIGGVNRKHAVLGTSARCVATYPGDFAQALMALDASVEIANSAGRRSMPFSRLHREPGDSPEIETTLAPGEIITAFIVPAGPWTRRSVYLKIRDRQSYEFALASAAVALELEGGVVRKAGIALGGVATRPWRAREAERELVGKSLNEASARNAAEAALAGASALRDNGYKIELARRTLVRALLQAERMEA
jgi:xanthine dehydrogenase YagS FAD-binding subunit